MIRMGRKSNRINNIELYTIWRTGITLSRSSENPYEMYFRIVYLREEKGKAITC